jgi:uncharacterized membrane protein (Fun14 family)
MSDVVIAAIAFFAGATVCAAAFNLGFRLGKESTP